MGSNPSKSTKQQHPVPHQYPIVSSKSSNPRKYRPAPNHPAVNNKTSKPCTRKSSNEFTTCAPSSPVCLEPGPNDSWVCCWYKCGCQNPAPRGPGAESAPKSDQSCERGVLMVGVPLTEAILRASHWIALWDDQDIELNSPRNQICNMSSQAIDLTRWWSLDVGEPHMRARISGNCSTGAAGINYSTTHVSLRDFWLSGMSWTVGDPGSFGMNVWVGCMCLGKDG